MLRRTVIFVLVLFSIYALGCAKKQPPVEETQEPLSMETLSSLNATTQAPGQVEPFEPKITQTQQPSVTTAPSESLAPLPPSGPYKPTAKEIQAALKNAGFYTGEIDGKIGPMTKKATEEFQKANGLKADGKVGPNTWAALSKYLNPTPAPAKTGKKKSRS